MVSCLNNRLSYGSIERLREVLRSDRVTLWASGGVMQRGARALASHGELADISHLAVENLDGSYALDLTDQSGLERFGCCISLFICLFVADSSIR